MKFSIKGQQEGFSLVELMIVVGIIGILATLAMPRFRQFQAKAKMGEAKNNLTHIYTLEQSYQLDNNTFIDFARYGRQADGSVNCNNVPTGAQDIGFEISPCTDAAAPVPRYGYLVQNSTRSVFDAQAISSANDNNLVCPGKAAHGFQVDENKEFTDDVGGTPALRMCF
ncbi:type IV pilin protein [Pseudobacteriovorax antillogorgiicola]|uniref:Prepilin-type N-terminal cleavage/methylation domain-containing protein n=1 Tax=Pseudobacteriovorax antillogorgiicola TaxID=1513793 RepID=A0A1Y6CAQ1_9BACT|nr:type II secretion system protein [Pseudobacteriovorax antillogorgiicola]TCS48704.1 prepilin-type N-terminal cleavage/methylation domain-containing protein [Pseudobacteriovorax antillogorgiicola]SMF54693.1 prepilin-type N-terminal cleavage/methylation domain-containing protein [Pseudobacteriovorax antillogorgiicola]